MGREHWGASDSSYFQQKIKLLCQDPNLQVFFEVLIYATKQKV